MRVLADMGISPRTVEFLRDLGHEGTHLYEKGLALCPNQEWQEADACFERVLEPHPNHKDGARLPSVCEDVRVGQVHHWDAQAARSGAG